MGREWVRGDSRFSYRSCPSLSSEGATQLRVGRGKGRGGGQKQGRRSQARNFGVRCGPLHSSQHAGREGGKDWTLSTEGFLVCGKSNPCRKSLEKGVIRGVERGNKLLGNILYGGEAWVEFQKSLYANPWRQCIKEKATKDPAETP